MKISVKGTLAFLGLYAFPLSAIRIALIRTLPIGFRLDMAAIGFAGICIASTLAGAFWCAFFSSLAIEIRWLAIVVFAGGMFCYAVCFLIYNDKLPDPPGPSSAPDRR
ncbi:MAG: hypothetical protein KGI79_00755 [Patescibacteria group bacterium]|nr:hypothetical protein [Patescibacteria group bacterium]MDE2116392.1 hypothetical protein [Patescibacteria group bacterium]